ncbi:hypothetical protein SDC9_42696 [bioreactor metagenome]|uniref:Uncharacterized protein n=1 Tax=bioreactor metagenome TaxID=1076179 RepID=A0A644VYF8_9ZZZZ|nr:hypothetical protein [Dehalococcoides mccartyi]
MKILQGFRASHRWMITSGLLAFSVLAVLSGAYAICFATPIFILFVFTCAIAAHFTETERSEQGKETGFFALYKPSHWISFITGAVITTIITVFKRDDILLGIFLFVVMVVLLYLIPLYIQAEQAGQEYEVKK